MLNTLEVFSLIMIRWPHRRPSGNKGYFVWTGESYGFPVKALPRTFAFLSSSDSVPRTHGAITRCQSRIFKTYKNLNLIQMYSGHLPKACLIHLMREPAGCVQAASKRIQSPST